MDLLLYQNSAYQVIVPQSKSNLLSKYFVPIFLFVFHPLEYHPSYDGNRFLDKPGLLMKLLL